MIKKTDSIRSEAGQVDTYTLENRGGSTLEVTTYGGRMLRLCVPDRDGKLGDVIVGFGRAEEYFGDNPYFGALVGRIANRVADCSFELNGTKYALDDNDGGKSLHGGFRGYDRRIWDVEIDGERLRLSLTSPDGDQGYPGKLEIKVWFSLSDGNEVGIEYEAVSDADTVCNLTSHTYYNLGGKECGNVLGHELQIRAKSISNFEDGRGELIPIAGTAFDFAEAKKIGRDVKAPERLIQSVFGFDFNYVLDKKPGEFGKFAEAYEPVSGRRMEAFTDQAGVQLYTSTFLEHIEGKRTYEQYAGMCLETQGYPYAPNCPEFPSVVLKKGEIYRHRTAYRFSVK